VPVHKPKHPAVANAALQHVTPDRREPLSVVEVGRDPTALTNVILYLGIGGEGPAGIGAPES